jgi:hypothetical protein
MSEVPHREDTESIEDDPIEHFLKTTDVSNHTTWKVTDPAFQELRARSEAIFHQSPCFWQMKISLSLLTQQDDIVCISGTGSGKSLVFWMPLLVRPNKIQVVITRRNLGPLLNLPVSLGCMRCITWVRLVSSKFFGACFMKIFHIASTAAILKWNIPGINTMY